MSTPSHPNADDTAFYGGSALLGAYLFITIPVVMSAWRCTALFCDLWMQILLAPVAIFMSSGLSRNALGILIGILVTGTLMYLLGSSIGRRFGR